MYSGLTRIFPLAIFTLAVFTLTGCSVATPHESVQKALKKSFDAKGYNYASTTRITKLSLPDNNDSDQAETVSERLSSLYLKKGIDIIRGFSIGINGAIDYRDTIRSEATYDLHYNRDNVDVSIKLPFLFDYSTKTLYMGKTFLNTIFPVKPEDEGKLIRFDLNDTLISALLGEQSMSQFEDAKARSINDAFKEGTIKAFHDVNGSQFTYQPLANDDKRYGSIQKVHVTLDRNESVRLILTVIDSLVNKMYAETMITKEAYGSYMLLSDPKQLDVLTEGVNLRLDFDFGIGADGRIVYLLSHITTSDTQNRFILGIENATSWDRFDAPLFTLDPKESGSIDYTEVFRDWQELVPKNSDEESFETIEHLLDQSGMKTL